MESIWETVSETSVRRWLKSYFLPAVIFLGLLALVSIDALVGWVGFWQWWSSIPSEAQLTLLAGILVGVLLLTVILDSLEHELLRWAEGYWPNLPLMRGFSASRKAAYSNTVREAIGKFDAFIQKKRDVGAVAGVLVDDPGLARLEEQMRYYSPDPEHALPTRVGNIIRAGEDHAFFRYGLSPVLAWPRLYPLIDQTLRDAVEEAKSSLDLAIRLIMLSVVFTLIAVTIELSQVRWLSAMIILVLGGVMAVLFYQWAIQSAKVYSDLLRVCFDMHRFDLYTRLHLPLPTKSGEEEKAIGERLSEHLGRGNIVVDYSHPEKGS